MYIPWPTNSVHPFEHTLNAVPSMPGISIVEQSMLVISKAVDISPMVVVPLNEGVGMVFW